MQAGMLQQAGRQAGNIAPKQSNIPARIVLEWRMRASPATGPSFTLINY
jgi:hypothetical protein